MNTATLNDQFALGTALRFVDDPGGLIIAEIENSLASARICMQGAHLLTWRPRSSSIPVVWLSEGAQLMPGKSPHSGAPVCWPWFGIHESDNSLPAHGYARNAPWQVVATSTEANGATRITLQLVDTEKSRTQWPHSAILTLTIVVGESLEMTMTTTNTGATAVVISEALHTYFQVGDIAQTRVTGLEGTTYADKVVDFARSVQQGTITFVGETDRVYVDTMAVCVIEDPVLNRHIRVAKSGSHSTVVWTPWKEKGDKMGDLGTDGWRHMLCVESANAMENRVTVPAGGSHALTVRYDVEPISVGP